MKVHGLILLRLKLLNRIKTRIKPKEYQSNKETIRILEESRPGIEAKSFSSV